VHTIADRRSIRSDVFWQSMDSCDHLLQIYGNENVFLDALEGFVGSALRGGEGAVVIATAPHIHELEKRLRARWIDVDRARWLHQYVAVLARETLVKFMVNGWPDEELFSRVAGKLLADARGADGRKVRAFGEMVSLLWSDGNVAAAVRLELLWSKAAAAEKFPVFCAYPRAGFESHEAAPMQSICAAHSQLLPG
jgi:DcmR-like sensory protein